MVIFKRSHSPSASKCDPAFIGNRVMVTRFGKCDSTIEEVTVLHVRRHVMRLHCETKGEECRCQEESGFVAQLGWSPIPVSLGTLSLLYRDPPPPRRRTHPKKKKEGTTGTTGTGPDPLDRSHISRCYVSRGPVPPDRGPAATTRVSRGGILWLHLRLSHTHSCVTGTTGSTSIDHF